MAGFWIFKETTVFPDDMEYEINRGIKSGFQFFSLSFWIVKLFIYYEGKDYNFCSGKRRIFEFSFEDIEFQMSFRYLSRDADRQLEIKVWFSGVRTELLLKN